MACMTISCFAQNALAWDSKNSNANFIRRPPRIRRPMGRVTRINQQSPSDMSEGIQTEKSGSSAAQWVKAFGTEYLGVDRASGHCRNCRHRFHAEDSYFPHEGDLSSLTPPL
jgi:hypothetical protein